MAVGAYQLIEVLKASARLKERGIGHSVSYLIEPGRFRAPRNKGEEDHAVSDAVRDAIVPPSTRHVLMVAHTRPEVMLGTLQPLWAGRSVKALGFINQGGTLDVEGMHFVNGCSWAHITREVAALMQIEESKVLTDEECQVLSGQISPDGIITKINNKEI